MNGLLSHEIAVAEGTRKDVLEAIKAALDAADPTAMVRRELKLRGGRLDVGGKSLDLDGYRRVVMVGGGKAAGLMAAEAERILGKRLERGVVLVPDYQKRLPRLKKVEFERSTHPLPSEEGELAVEKMLRLVDGVGAGDLVVVLLSGGGSALMPSPPTGVTVPDLAATTDLLMKAGADIYEVNCVRKHLSQIAGGRLAERTRGADVLTLVVSDVVGDDLSYIASGPTAPDPTTYRDARRIMEDRKVWKRAPLSVRRALETGTSGQAEETPKPGSHVFDRVSNVIIGSNADACSAAKRSLESRGYGVVLSTGVTGEAREVGRELAKTTVSTGARRWAAVWGGETTVTVRGRGVGGRNQEAALAAALELGSSPDAVIAFVDTDGVDGPTGAAGAIADGRTIERARRRGLDARLFLRRSDSHEFFRMLGDLVVTGPTGTNVNDVMVAAKG